MIPNEVLLYVDSSDLDSYVPGDLLGIEIDRADIEKGRIAGTLNRLMALTDTREAAYRFRETLVFVINGYDVDTIAIANQPEVRAFFRALNDQWPFWLWFLRRDTGIIPLFMALLCDVSVSYSHDAVSDEVEFANSHELTRNIRDCWLRTETMYIGLEIDRIDVEESALSAWHEFFDTPAQE